MYCSACGSVVKPNLTFCNRCGAKLKNLKSEEVSKSDEAPAEALVWAIVAVFSVGLGATIGLMAVMKQVLHFNNGLISAFAGVSFLVMLIVEIVFISMLLRKRRPPVAEDDIERLRDQVIAELSAAPVRLPGDPAVSVTEHTTHSFHSNPK